MIAGASAACFRRGDDPLKECDRFRIKCGGFSSSHPSIGSLKNASTHRVGEDRGQKIGLVSNVMPSRYDRLMTKPKADYSDVQEYVEPKNPRLTFCLLIAADDCVDRQVSLEVEKVQP
jgi:hypothetical protein